MEECKWLSEKEKGLGAIEGEVICTHEREFRGIEADVHEVESVLHRKSRSQIGDGNRQTPYRDLPPT